MKPRKAVTKYLQRYSSLTDTFAEQLTAFMRQHTMTHYTQAVVIPAYNESAAFLDRFSKVPGNCKTLLIVIANCPGYASESAKQQTAKLIEYAEKHFAKKSIGEAASFGQLNTQTDLLLLDIRAEQSPLVKEQVISGVGFARKLGMDTAFALWCHKLLSSPWIYSSDADAFWPSNYLTFAKNNLTQKGAAVFAFNHQQTEHDGALSDAAALYDISLRYYVLGLRWAKSPWAYHTIGSTLLIHAESYAETRGFPTREAGEDFYLLNKIAKTGTIYCPSEPKLSLSDRPSDRVPFGTGPAVSRIETYQHPQKDFMLYHPAIFSVLKEWHHLMPQLYTFCWEELNPHTISSELFVSLQQGLDHLGLAKALQHARKQVASQQQFNQHLWQWFDGFRTLKLIHWLRDNKLASISYSQWETLLRHQQIPFLPAADTHPKTQPTPNYLSSHLQKHEESTLPFKGGLY